MKVLEGRFSNRPDPGGSCKISLIYVAAGFSLRQYRLESLYCPLIADWYYPPFGKRGPGEFSFSGVRHWGFMKVYSLRLHRRDAGAIMWLRNSITAPTGAGEIPPLGRTAQPLPPELCKTSR
jgi:hypothetical protein